jgi:hypothetical protein
MGLELAGGSLLDEGASLLDSGGELDEGRGVLLELAGGVEDGSSAGGSLVGVGLVSASAW